MPRALSGRPAPQALAHPSLAKACGACARHDTPALVMEGIDHSYEPDADTLNGVSICLHPGEIVALVGPSGCGKTTTLRLAAGLERLQEGYIEVGGAVAATPDFHLPAEDRHVGMMFQDYALFPHLTVLENVAFGLTGISSAEKRERALSALSDVGLADLADRNPGTLSGVQQQRAALARALAPRPSVVLLDEPFSGLDAELRRQIRGDAIHLLKAAGAGALLVTHDAEEALFMAERIAVMREGRIEQQGDPRALYDHPASPYVAQFFSEINSLDGVVKAGVADTALGLTPAVGLADGAATVMARPEHLLIGDEAKATGRAVLGNVTLARWLGRTALIELCLPGGEMVMARTHEALSPAEGETMYVALDADRAFVFPPEENAGESRTLSQSQRALPESLAIRTVLR